MRQNHGVNQADATSQPCGTEMRSSIQYVDCEEHESELVFNDAKTPKKPIGDESVGEKTSTESIQRKQSREFGEHFSGLRLDAAPDGQERSVTSFHGWRE